MNKESSSNKENAKAPFRSKIPVPLDPLPPLSEKVRMKHEDNKTERIPLETIYQESTNPDNVEQSKEKSKVDHIKKNIKKKKVDVNKIDSRFVTIRSKNEDLDWNYKVFNDRSLHDKTYCCEAHYENTLGENSKSLTPAPKSLLEPSRVKNIKKSLRRPHSRELVGISPTDVNVKREEKYKRRLDFTERKEDKTQEPAGIWLDLYAGSLDEVYGKDMFRYLLKKENFHKMSNISHDTRACLINWLIKVNGPEGSSAVVQAATWYLDAVLALSEVSVDKLQVLAAACYWISLKIHGRSISAKRLVKYSGHAFSIALLLSAEKAVMKKLEFPPQPIIPQEFVAYWSWVSDAGNFNQIETAATIMSMAGLMLGMIHCKQYPSVIAAAAVTNALLLLDKHVLLVKLSQNDIYKLAEKKTSNFECVCALQRQAIRTLPVHHKKAFLECYDHSVVLKLEKSVATYEALDKDTLHDSHKKLYYLEI